MNYWLVKFAPFRYSWQDILRNGKFEIYSVRNAQARNNLRAMKLNDEVLFYHSQKENCIMGIMKVIEEAHQDKTTNDAKWVSVTFEPLQQFATPVSLKVIKETTELKNIALLKQPRLAVMPIGKMEHNLIVELGNQNP
jgi:predicted RNA-binding protein with PUA-like domain